MDTHRKLLAWQPCRELIREVYKATEAFPASERFGLTSQLRRAAVSAASNIAEGFGRWGIRETAHGLSISFGSLAEVDSLLAVSEDLDYLPPPRLKRLEDTRLRASQLVMALHKKIRQQAAR